MAKTAAEQEAEKFLADIDQLGQAQAASLPKPTNQVYFLPGGATAPAGGRAASSPKPKTPGGRFNRPTAEDNAAYEATLSERTEFIEQDAVVQSARGKDPLALLSTLKAEVARESAALAYQRLLNEKMGRDITQVSSRRIDAIKKIADIEMEMRKIGFDQIDIHSEKFQRIFKLWIENIRTVAEQTLTPEQLDLFFNRLQTEMDGWEDKAADLIR